jgi:sensor histidine kinase YesM
MNKIFKFVFMLSKSLYQVLSFKRLLLFLVVLTTLVQLVVITYNHLTGYDVLIDFQHFFFRLTVGVLLSAIMGFFIAYPDLYLISYLNEVAPWNKKLWKRLFIELPVTILIALFVSMFFTLIGNSIKPYPDLVNVFINNALIFIVVNIITIIILEGWLFSIESRKAKQTAENLRKELSQIKFEVLKSQINPHFMFNSLNVLSGLISQDNQKAQQFIDEFSYVYRHVLETIEQPVTTLGKELDFARSYMFLQQMRYGDKLTYSVNIESEALNYFLPPLSLQILLENALKHNTVNESKPLHIDIWDQNEVLMVRNPLQPKMSMGKSTGLGLKNIKKRYELICSDQPHFGIENQFYIAKLPLVKSDDNERSDY